MLQLYFLIKKRRLDIWILFPRFYDLSVSRNPFSKSENREICENHGTIFFWTVRHKKFRFWARVIIFRDFYSKSCLCCTITGSVEEYFLYSTCVFSRSGLETFRGRSCLNRIILLTTPIRCYRNLGHLIGQMPRRMSTPRKRPSLAKEFGRNGVSSFWLVRNFRHISRLGRNFRPFPESPPFRKRRNRICQQARISSIWKFWAVAASFLPVSISE